jgi:hypothetical protein
MGLLYAGEAMADKRSGVLLFNEEARFTEPQQEIMVQLKKDEFGEPAVKFTLKKIDLFVIRKTAKAGQFNFSPAFMKSATKIK